MGPRGQAHPPSPYDWLLQQAKKLGHTHVAHSKKLKKTLAHHIHTCYIAQMRRRNLYIPDPLMERVQKLAVRKKVHMADIIRTAMEKYLDAVDRAEAKAKEEAQHAER